MTRLAPASTGLILMLSLFGLAGCDLASHYDNLEAQDITRLTLPRVNRVQRPEGDVEKLEAPNLAKLERDPFLTHDENVERKRRLERAKVRTAPVRRAPARSPAKPIAAELEVIRKELNEQVPLIIVGEGPNPRNIAILKNGTVLEEGHVIQDYYVVERIESDGIRIGSTDGKYQSRLPFARSSPDASRGEWNFGK